MTDAVERELIWVKNMAGAPRELRLGCSTISHRKLGFCDGCSLADRGSNGRLEVLAWRLLALREDS